MSGTSLAAIEPSDPQLLNPRELAAAEARERAAEAALKRAEPLVESARADLAFAESELARQRELHSENAASISALEDAERIYRRNSQAFRAATFAADIARFELEQALIRDELAVADLPSAWNEKYQQYLGITPPNDADGVLQDVHWSAALFGYFPTYSLGNLYAGHFCEQAASELGDLNDMFRQGEFRPLREWLRNKVHQHGQCYTASQLLAKICNTTLSVLLPKILCYLFC